jgi:hypothetical protein
MLPEPVPFVDDDEIKGPDTFLLSLTDLSFKATLSLMALE